MATKRFWVMAVLAGLLAALAVWGCGEGGKMAGDATPEGLVSPGDDTGPGLPEEDGVVPEEDGVVPEEDGFVPAPDITQPDYGEVYVTPEDKEFLQQYKSLLAESQDMTTEELFAKHYAERPYLDKPGFDAKTATYYDLIKDGMGLTAPEEKLIADKGFAVLDRVQWGSHPLGYMEVFAQDLPVLITTDSILFAIHKSYDLMLKDFEEETLIPALEEILLTAHLKIAGLMDAGEAEVWSDALKDVDLIYSVARSLLSGTPEYVEFGENEERRDELLALIEAKKPQLIDLFGRPYPCAAPGCAYDFSQFEPRGHYTDSEELKRYFKAMIWLGRTEMVLTKFHREFVASYVMLRTLDTEAMELWEGFDQAIQVFVGKSDNLTFEGLEKFIADQGVEGLDAVADPAQAAALMAALEKGGYAQQKIMSQIMAVDPMSGTPDPLPPVFLFLGQRFVIDSYILHNVTFDRIVFEGEKMWRMLPEPLDVMFVFGFQESLPLLKEELDQWHYAQNVHVMKFLVDSYDADFWSASMYNVWLDAIRALSEDSSGEEYPDAMRTLEYEHKMINTGLASWAELRHDTILYVKQSYSGVACDYPDGYVEPFPEFFSRVATFAKTSKALMESLDLPFGYGKDYAIGYFIKLEKAAVTLGGIAEKELKQEPRTPDETAFIKSTVVEDSMCGSAPFSGWYTDLFYNVNDMTFDFDPTIADIHTDPNAGDILHIGTGKANAMVLIAETSCGLKAYVGPVSSYYKHIETGFNRLTDEDWKSLLTNTPPPRPEWTAGFVAK